jgi:hypothetical protein
MTNDFEIEFLIFLLQSLSMETISERFDNHLHGYTFPMFLRILKHYPVPISSRAFHALYTIPWRSRLTKTNAQPTQTMSVTIHEKRLFPSLIFWNLSASAFFLFSVFINLFLINTHAYQHLIG